ncbi:hypothetical protein [sulfur-oxidizing endosymbiont of Gigantopelta aegis]|uniref:hypothetical protein n=1 Tax=sulfur-oxidizing endosymbiont of Gigantopelta aegis TaxID=2794934 RepID=UPI0018DD27AB|nr:hypothetical protein [sulfur-oxidizing endosymbiont of Gigantopelta aegis]
MKSKKNTANVKLLVHASNVTGLGAIQVVGAFINAITKINSHEMLVACPEQLPYCHRLKVSTVTLRRVLPNSLSRLFECLFPHFYFPGTEQLIVLGDIPLRNYQNQVVLFHQPNLIRPHINKNTGMTFKFKILRLLFRYNLKFVRKMIVQTIVMKEQLEQSYPELRDRIVVIPQPAPDNDFLHAKNWDKPFNYNKHTKLTLFLDYP